MKRYTYLLLIAVLSCFNINAQDGYNKYPASSTLQLKGNNFQSNNLTSIVMPGHQQTINAKDYIKNSKNLDGDRMSNIRKALNEAPNDSAYVYSWSADWDLSYRIYYYFNTSSIDILQEQLNPDGTWGNYYKRVLEYYSTGNFRRETASYWKNSSSEWKTRSYEEYNTHGKALDAYSKDWNDTTQEFTKGGRIISSYEKDTLLKTETYQKWDTVLKGWMNVLRININYNANDLISDALESVWKDGVWRNSYSIDYAYNGFGELETETAQEWDTISSIWNNDLMIERQYNSTGNITNTLQKKWDTDASDWVNYIQRGVNYDAFFKVESLLVQIWEGSMWNDSLKASYTYNAEGNVLQYMEEIWNISDWIGIYRENTTYSSTEVTIEINEGDTINKTWENDMLITYLLNNQGVALVEQRDYWISTLTKYEIGYYNKYEEDGTNPEYYAKAWNDTLNKFTGGIRVLNSYDQSKGGLVQRIIQEWDTVTVDWINFQKTDYYWSPTSVESINQSGAYKIYPSPFTSTIYIEKEDDHESSAILRIFNLSGKLIHQGKLTDRRTKLDLSYLKSGIYVAEISTQKGRSNIKLVKH